MTLVATNVAARGLDINDVQLIIQVLLMHLLNFVLSWIVIIIFLIHGDICTSLSVNLRVM